MGRGLGGFVCPEVVGPLTVVGPDEYTSMEGERGAGWDRLRAWLTASQKSFRISDHYPLWVEFGIP
jgi:hypothetical protein